MSKTVQCARCGGVVVQRFPSLPKYCVTCRPILQREWRLTAARRYSARRYQRWREAGCCGWCGLPSGVHRTTGQAYALCFSCRVADTTRRRVPA